MAVIVEKQFYAVVLVCTCIFHGIAIGATDNATDGDYEVLTPTPFLDINKDLRPIHLGKNADYFLSNYKTDARSARAVCQNLTALTGKHFHLLMLETREELEELQSKIENLDVGGIWIGGEKTFDDEGKISMLWVTEDGKQRMAFFNFRDGVLPTRRKRELPRLRKLDEGISENKNVSSNLLYPWLPTKEMVEGSGRCRTGKWEQKECEPIECNITLPECTTETRPCVVKEQTECTVQRPECSAKCGECTLKNPECFLIPKPCTVTTQECQVVRPPCTVETPPCTTTRPPCKTTQPPCQVVEPPPCTTQPPCIPSFRKDNCTEITPPCETNSKNVTVCPPKRTVCEPSYRCPPPQVCQSPAILCPPPLVYCEPETTICPDPIVTCPKPVIYCPEPVVNCPDPEIKCTQPSVVCSSPVVSCPGLITSCPSPVVECPAPIVACSDPQVECSEPEPCPPPPSIPYPPCPEEPTLPTTTTERPCDGCGCCFMNHDHKYKWDIDSCQNEFHFICEG